MNRAAPFAVFIAIGMLFSIASSTARATIVLSISDTNGDPYSANVTPGSTFSIDIRLDTTQAFTGLSFYLQSANDASGRFSIVGRSTAPSNPVAEESQSTDAEILAQEAAKLNPTNDHDLGYLGDVFNNVDPGSYAIETLTIRADATIPLGQFSFIIIDGLLTDADFSEYAISSNIYIVNTPEPTIGSVLVGSMCFALARRRFR